MLAVVGDGAGAEAAARRALQIAPDRAESGSLLGLALLEQGRLEESREVYGGNPFPFFRLEGLALVSHAMGRPDESQAALDDLVRTQASSAAFQIAGVYAFRGEADRAFEWLERARAQHDEGLEHLLTDPFLAGIRGDSRWKPVLRKMNVPTD
jgi:tetratricopeptide (TPR) repeat protein